MTTKQGMQQQGFGEMKFYCDCKKEYSLNMQAICDSMGRFLDIEIAFPGAATTQVLTHCIW